MRSRRSLFHKHGQATAEREIREVGLDRNSTKSFRSIPEAGQAYGNKTEQI
jgi:hypothetical protein